MNTRTILLALAGASVIAGGQALAQVRVGVPDVSGAVRGSTGTGVNVRGLGRTIDTGARLGTNVRTRARVNSQGSLNASGRARARANVNSAIRDPNLVLPDLSTLATGMVVLDADGDRIGTVARINRASSGQIVNVLVRSARRTIPLTPTTLAITTDGRVMTSVDFDLD